MPRRSSTRRTARRTTPATPSARSTGRPDGSACWPAPGLCGGCPPGCGWSAGAARLAGSCAVRSGAGLRCAPGAASDRRGRAVRWRRPRGAAPSVRSPRRARPVRASASAPGSRSAGDETVQPGVQPGRVARGVARSRAGPRRVRACRRLAAVGGCGGLAARAAGPAATAERRRSRRQCPAESPPTAAR